MRYKLILLLLLTACLFSSPAVALTYELDFSGLLDEPESFDGRLVTVRGEVVGDLLRRGDNCWVSVNDGAMAMGVWTPLEEAEKIKVAGDYSHFGDMISLTGFFNKACELHGGDMDIHAENISVIHEGYEHKRPINRARLYQIPVLLLICAALYFLSPMLKKSPG